MTDNIITYILTYKTEKSFITHIEGVIEHNNNSNFFLIYSSSDLIKIISNYKEGAKFRLLIHKGTTKAKNDGVKAGSIAIPIKNNPIFSNCNFDFTTRDDNEFDSINQLVKVDQEGNYIHNAQIIDNTVIDRTFLYEIKDSKAICSKSTIAKSNGLVEKIVILTALEIEMLELKKYLNCSKDIFKSKESQFYYDKYDYETQSEKKFEIYLKVAGKQNFVSSSATTSAIKDINPDYLFFIGIAGKLKDVEIGDVVIADRVENYEPGKNEDNGNKVRIFQGHADEYLLSIASSIVTDNKNIWQSNIKVGKDERILNNPKDTIGRIATGEKVLGSITSELYKEIRQSCSESLAVECEGGGFYVACNKMSKRGLLIRGISDKLKDKAFVEEFGSQPYASSCASSFLFELIDKL